MRTMHRRYVSCLAITVSLMASMVLAQGAVPATVEFAPDAAAALQKTYGSREEGALRAAILAALGKEQRHDALPEGVSLKVTVRQVKPTHPTLQQQLDNPSLSAARTRYLGGADLVGEVRDARQQVLATVDYRNFADVPAAGSPSLDPWADARQAIEGFAAKFASAWERLPKG